jgi:hypothetical protein
MTEITRQNFKELIAGQEKRIPNLQIFDEFYYGIDSKGLYFFTYRGQFKHPHNVISTQLLQIELITENPNTTQLRISLKDNEFSSIFIKLIYLVIGEVEALEPTTSDQDKFYVVLTVLNDWKELFRSAKNDKLSENRIIGLLGELMFLQYISDNTNPQSIAVETWQGPHGNDEDFSLNGSVYEVKSSKSSQNNLIKINSLRQINSENVPTFLIHQSFSVTVNDGPNSVSLYNIVNDMYSKVKFDHSKLAELEYKLFKSGYIHDVKYTEPTYALDASSYYLVGPDFPLIYSDLVDPRISRVRYTLDLDRCKEFLVSELPFEV